MDDEKKVIENFSMVLLVIIILEVFGFVMMIKC